MTRAFCVALAIACALAAPADALANQPNIQPLPITASSQPFGAMVPNSAPGMTEREYMLSGHARTFTDSGPTGQAPAYVTRVLVRIPANFNGAVVVELLNNSAGFEVEPMWDYLHAELTRQGIGWVGVTYDPAAIGFLQGWNPQRYAALGGGIADPSQVWDIVSQVGWLSHQLASSPLVVLTGYSGPAPTVAAWANHFGRSASAYGGYLIGGSFGDVATLSENALAPGAIDPRLPGPVIRLDTETEVLATLGATRQADGPHLRTWEIAGGSHIDGSLAQGFDTMLGRDLGLPPIATLCTNPINPLSVGDASDAALADLLRWANTGTPAPVADRIALDSGGNIVRDANGNALGGLRLPGITAPTGTLGATNVRADDSALAQAFCPLVGSYQPFSAARLAALYPSHLAYVRQVKDRVATLERTGFLVDADGARLVHEAAASGIGG
jgi:hypothetical protein